FLIQRSNAQEKKSDDTKSFWDITRQSLHKLGNAIVVAVEEQKQSNAKTGAKTEKPVPAVTLLYEKEKEEIKKAEQDIESALNKAKDTLEKIGEELKSAADKLIKTIHEMFPSEAKS
ncbi:hypothetical protein ILUMI_09571, partial [Ignelater luminosus]